jgi:3-oxoadipate enol-lactonase
MKQHLHPVSKTIKSHDGVEIYYEKVHTGNKKWLIFLHGLGGDLTAWNEERDKFHQLGYSTLAIDLRGHGLSGRPKDFPQYDFKNFMLDVLFILQHEKISKPVLVGHCLGGMIAMMYAAHYPTMLSSLILIDTGYKPPVISEKFIQHEWFNYMLSSIAPYSPCRHLSTHTDFQKFKNTTDFNWKRVMSDVLHVSLRSYLYICEVLTNFDATSLLNRIKVPTLILEGTEDSVFPPNVANDLHHRIIKSELHFIPGANHILVFTSPNELVKVMENFLTKQFSR